MYIDAHIYTHTNT